MKYNDMIFNMYANELAPDIDDAIELQSPHQLMLSPCFDINGNRLVMLNVDVNSQPAMSK